MDNSERPPLSKTRSTSSSFHQGRRPSRTASTKYGSIVEERKHRHEEESDEYEQDQQENDNGIFEIPEEDERLEMARQRGLSTDRMSMNSYDHEITLKERQEVYIKKDLKKHNDITLPFYLILGHE